MKSLWLLLLAPLSAQAAESYVVGGELQSALDAYARSANLLPLKDSGRDELRIWSFDYMSGRVEGFAISRSGSIRCQTKYHYKDRVITIDRARCRPWQKRESAIDALESLAPLNGKEWDCPMFDGGGFFVEGVRNGRRVGLRVSNPGACKDAGSRAVIDLVRKVW